MIFHNLFQLNSVTVCLKLKIEHEHNVSLDIDLHFLEEFLNFQFFLVQEMAEKVS